jgi:PKD repeat protein
VAGAPQRLEARAVDNESGGKLLYGTFTATALSSEAPTSRIDRPSRDTTVLVGSSVVFQGTATGGSIHAWTFGDGGTASSEDPGARSYAATGSYTVTYRVTDGIGRTSVPDSVTVAVTAAAPPTSNYALRFFGNGRNDIDRVKIRVGDNTSTAGPPVNVGATNFTIEFWVRGALADNRGNIGNFQCNNPFEGWIEGNIIIDRDRNSQDNDYGVSFTDGFIAFGVARPTDRWFTLCGDIQVLDNQWHHVALTRNVSTGRLCAYVDGVQDQCGTGPTGNISYPATASDGDNGPFIVLGAEKHDAGAAFPSFNGFMDELRFSNVIRYTASFQPPGRFVPDAQTVGLYHMDEGQGTVLGDSSGAAIAPHWGTVTPPNQQGALLVGGSPAGPAWVASGAPTGG